MRVDRQVAEAYAAKVLDTGPAICSILREQVDFSSGEFEATNSFVEDAEGHWADARWQPGEVGGEVTLKERCAPLLIPGRALLLGSAYVVERVIEAVPPVIRLVHRRVEKGIETHYLLPGPLSDPADMALPLHASQGMHHAVGAVTKVDTNSLPDHQEFVSEQDLRALLATPLLVFMRMTSYQGYLMWTRSDGAT